MMLNKLAVYFVADIDFPCGRYRLAVADMVVADMVAPRVSVRVKVQPTNITC